MEQNSSDESIGGATSGDRPRRTGRSLDGYRIEPERPTEAVRRAGRRLVELR